MNTTITNWSAEVNELKVITRIIMRTHDGEPSFEDTEEVCVLLKAVFDRLEILENTMDRFLEDGEKNEA